MLDIAPGTVLGQYVVHERIGRGATSTVYRGHHPALDREVAVKVLWSPLADDSTFQERFRREARTVSRLRHPNVLTVYDFGTRDGVTYMVTELLPGGDLAERLLHSLSVNRVRGILAGVAAALDYAHANGVVHRDVKPSNIVFSRDDEPVLTDFGIATLFEGEHHITAGGAPAGTPAYMSPEQAAGKEVGPWSDLYSLGIVLYEMLAGKTPFQSPTWAGLLRAHVEDPPPKLSTVDEGFAPELEAVLERTLAKEPAQRYPNGQALVQAFDAVLAELADRPTPRPFPTLPATNSIAGAPKLAAEEEPPAEETAEVETLSTVQVIGDYDDYRGAPTAVIETADGSWTRSTEATAPRRPRAGTTPLPAQRADAASSSGLPSAPLLFVIALALAVVAGLLIGTALRLRQPGSAPTQGTPAVQRDSSPPGSSAAVGSATVPPAAVVNPAASPPVAPAGQASPPSAPEATADPRRGPLAVEMLTPTDGSQIPAKPTIRGRRSGLQGPDDHLWLLVHPRGSNDLWWPYPNELIANGAGVWEVADAEFGGAAGSQHELVVGVADAETHRAIAQQVAERPGEPFQNGPPPGFRTLTSITVTKASQ
jgi:serine/threonine protein kinase